MIEYTLHTVESAPSELRQILSESQAAYGFLPNLYSVMSHSPGLMQGYLGAYQLFTKTSLSAVEQQIVLLSVSFENACTYCVAAHTTIAKMGKIESAVIEAIRNGTAIVDPKLEALRKFTQLMVSSRGLPSNEAIDAFLSAGYNRQQILDVILGIGVKTMSNYTNHMANTPLDQAFAGCAS